MLRWKVYFSFKLQALAPRGLVLAPTTKFERISGAFALDKSNFLSCSSSCCVGLVVRFFRRKKKIGKANKAVLNVPAKILSV